MIAADMGKPPSIPLQKIHTSFSAHSVCELEALGFLKLQKSVVVPCWCPFVQLAVSQTHSSVEGLEGLGWYNTLSAVPTRGQGYCRGAQTAHWCDFFRLPPDVAREAGWPHSWNNLKSVIASCENTVWGKPDAHQKRPDWRREPGDSSLGSNIPA